ncbi:hypothetical protein HYV85_04880 [Candidatus Woesearchaeota archaeon]|nr:hypothetical protein [Candidatus Woesearchaeota archaeon]
MTIVTQMNQHLTPVNDAIDEAVLKYYPAYAEAAKISGMVQELVRGVVDYSVRFDEQRRDCLVTGNGDIDRFFRYTLADLFGLVDSASAISRQIQSGSKETRGILFKHFFDDVADYVGCLYALELIAREMPNEITLKV